MAGMRHVTSSVADADIDIVMSEADRQVSAATTMAVGPQPFLLV